MPCVGQSAVRGHRAECTGRREGSDLRSPPQNAKLTWKASVLSSFLSDELYPTVYPTVTSVLALQEPL